MRLSHLLLIASAALLLIVLGSFFLSPSLRPAAAAHPVHESVGITLVGSLPTLWWGYAMGLAICATLAASVLLGVRRRGRIGPLGVWLAAGFLCLGLIFTALVVSYARYAGGTDTGFFGGLPAPTAWMIYVVWPFPLLMILVCMAYFESQYFSDDDQRAFDDLIRSSRQGREERD